jgi:putative membrane protein
MWNELATIFLICIVMLAVVKQLLDVAWAVGILVAFSALLFLAIKVYKKYRKE